MSVINKALTAGTLVSGGMKTYRVVKPLGAGGFGITYLVESREKVNGTELTSFYAMKEHFLNRCCERPAGSTQVVYSNPVADEVENSLKDFIAEAGRLQKLGNRHNNIVRVHEIFQTNNTAYYIMEFLQGQSLREYVKSRGRLSPNEMLAIMTPVIDAVGFLHANRMTHLDIKPDNIMLTPDTQGQPRPVLIDFGLSKHYDGNGSPTSTINTLGCSDGYSPVEQYGGITNFQPTADIYALGATMAFCVTGQNPKKSTEMLPGDLHAMTAGLSPALASLMIQMMDMNRMARPQNISQVIHKLDAPASQMPPAGNYGAMPGGYGQPPYGYAGTPGGPGMPPPPPAGFGQPPYQNPGMPGSPKKSNKTLFIVLGALGGVLLLGGLLAIILALASGYDRHDYDRVYQITQYTDPDVSIEREYDSPANQQHGAPMRVTLSWDSDRDLDLYIVEPGDNLLYFADKRSASTGGRLGDDDTGGPGSSEKATWTRPGAGTYDFFISARNLSLGEEVSATLKLYVNGHVTVYDVTMKGTTDESPEFYLVKSLTLDRGLTNSSGDAVTDADGPADSYNSGNVVSEYVEAETSTAPDSQAVSRANSVGRNTSLKVTLLWDSSNDLDLIVNQANGTDIYYGNRNDSSYGARHTGDRTGGNRSFESVSWTNPGSGIYDVFVRVRGTVPRAGIPVKVVVKNGSNTTTYFTRITKSGSSMADVRICQFTY